MHKSSFRNFLDNTSASAAIEFALVFPIFLILTLGIIELALMSFGNSVISNTMLHATRQAMIGSYGATPDNQITEARIKDMIRRKSAGLVNFDNGNGTISAYVITSGEMQSVANRFTATPISNAVGSILNRGATSNGRTVDSAIGERGSVVIYTVTYDWPRFFRYLSNLGIFSNVTSYRAYSVVPHMG